MAKAIHPRTSCDKSYLATCLLRDIGAAAGLLLPKCPLCWMAITGSVVTGTATKLSVEILSLLLFAAGSWNLLRLRLQSATSASFIACGATIAVGTVAWLVHDWKLRLLVWMSIIAATTLISRRSSVHEFCHSQESAIGQ